MFKFKGRLLAIFLSFITALSVGTLGAEAQCTAVNSAEITLAAYKEIEASLSQQGEKIVTPSSTAALSTNIKVGSRILDLFFGKDKIRSTMLIPGGNVFGAKIKQKYVTVTESKGIPALSAGDVILEVNGNKIHSADEVRDIVEAAKDSSVTIKALHNDTPLTIEARPTLIDGEYRLGISLRDGAMGIGTVTFINPETGAFGGLGHGICDSEHGDVIEIESGIISGVLLAGVHKGEPGKPGELSGILTDESIGSLTSNNGCGVFGVIEDEHMPNTEPIPVATRAELREGDATIISTIKNGKPMQYSITISDIDRTATGSKCFRITVTDSTLIALSGGIVRGMSGSPIIQDGKLIGAVTHVMVADPTEGYGIFIENMLNAAEMPTERAA